MLLGNPAHRKHAPCEKHNKKCLDVPQLPIFSLWIASTAPSTPNLSRNLDVQFDQGQRCKQSPPSQLHTLVLHLYLSNSATIIQPHRHFPPSEKIWNTTQVMVDHLMVSVMIAARWSLLNRMLSVFFPFLNVMMNSLLGWLA